VKGCKTLEESLDRYTSSEYLVGENQYRVEGFGLQDAVRSCQFETIPPIFIFQLKRFLYNPEKEEMEKVYFHFISFIILYFDCHSLK
jgi:ubiquitin carboxyl-terminal hydrolase 7